MLQSALEMRYAARAMEWVCTMIQMGKLRPGDRIPAERELARRLRANKASIRTAVDYLATIGVIKMRHVSGAVVTMGPEELSELSSDLIERLRPSEVSYLYEARAVLEGNIAALAAQQHDARFWPQLAEELAEMYALVENPREYLVHEMVFHRTIAQATNNPVLSALMVKITTAFYDTCRDEGEFEQDLQASADRHRRIYRAIRNGRPVDARVAMEEHLRTARIARRQSQAPENAYKTVGQSM